LQTYLREGDIHTGQSTVMLVLFDPERAPKAQLFTMELAAAAAVHQV
jgi:hypothetical protein